MSRSTTSHFNIKADLDKLDQHSAAFMSTMIMKDLQEGLQDHSLNHTQKKFLKSVITQGTMKFYLFPSFNPAEPSIGVASKNLKAIMHVAFHTTDKKFLKFYDSPYIIDLLHIHSFQKGEGRKLMAAFKELQKATNVPGSLWTESEKNVDYFKQFGFENLGRLGSDGEFLMMLPKDAK